MAAHEHDAMVAKATKSDFFSADGVAGDMRRFLHTGWNHAVEVGATARNEGRVVFVGSGGSLACLITGQYILDHLLPTPVAVVPARELRWRSPAWMDSTTTVVLNSWSGRNADVLDALEFAKSRGARTIAVVADPQSPLAAQVDETVPSTGRSIYEVPIVAMVALALGMGARNGRVWQEAIEALPAQLEASAQHAAQLGESVAREHADTSHFYVLGAGPNSGLGLKLANVLMENVRVGASFYDTVEFRHGAVEALDRNRLNIISLVGTDQSRKLTEHIGRFSTKVGSRVAIFDAAPLGCEQPLLSPLFINSATQWFVLHSALARGIANLDERVFMGKSALSEGSWP